MPILRELLHKADQYQFQPCRETPRPGQIVCFFVVVVVVVFTAFGGPSHHQAPIPTPISLWVQVISFSPRIHIGCIHRLSKHASHEPDWFVSVDSKSFLVGSAIVLPTKYTQQLDDQIFFRGMVDARYSVNLAVEMSCFGRSTLNPGNQIPMFPTTLESSRPETGTRFLCDCGSKNPRGATLVLTKGRVGMSPETWIDPKFSKSSSPNILSPSTTYLYWIGLNNSINYFTLFLL